MKWSTVWQVQARLTWQVKAEVSCLAVCPRRAAGGSPQEGGGGGAGEYLVVVGTYGDAESGRAPSLQVVDAHLLTLHPTPYALHPTPCTLHPAPYTLHLIPYTLHPARYRGTGIPERGGLHVIHRGVAAKP